MDHWDPLRKKRERKGKERKGNEEVEKN